MRFALYKEESEETSVRSRHRSNSLPEWMTMTSFNGDGGRARLSILNNNRPTNSNGGHGHSLGCKRGRKRRVSFVESVSAADQCGTTYNGTRTASAWWWEPDREDSCDTVDFASETSLHGLKYIVQPSRHIVERVFWFIAFLTGVIMAGWLISDVWLTYLSSPLIVTFEPFETSITKIPFPAITICNMNKVLKSRAEEYIRAAEGPDLDETTIEARKNVYYLDHVCSSSKSFSQKFNFSSKRGQVGNLNKILERTRVEDGDDEQRDVAKFLQIASQPCQEMLLLCAWQDSVYNCSELFKPIETDFGKCCTFNMIPHMLLYKNLHDRKYDPKEVIEWSKWDIEKTGLLIDDNLPNDVGGQQHQQPKLFPRRQKRAGKSSGLSVLLNPDLDEYFCTSSDSHGFQLVKHLPIDVPKLVDFGTAIKPGSEVFMGIRPEITMADQDIRNFKLEKRNCYFYGEFQLAYYKHYTSSNCYDECLANQTYERCGCVSYFMPRDDTRDLCGATSFSCAENVRQSALLSGIKSLCDFCYPSCIELEYFSETTSTPLQPASDIWMTDLNVTSSWANKNVSIVHIYFSSDSTYARVRKELYGITDLIANTGGLMGLCLGFSGLSLVELIYFYTLRAWCRTRRRRSMWVIAKMKFHRLWIKGDRKRPASKQNYCHCTLQRNHIALPIRENYGHNYGFDDDDEEYSNVKSFKSNGSGGNYGGEFYDSDKMNPTMKYPQSRSILAGSRARCNCSAQDFSY